MSEETKSLLRDPKALADYLTEKAWGAGARANTGAIGRAMADAATTIIAEHAADRPLAGEMTLRELGERFAAFDVDGAPHVTLARRGGEWHAAVSYVAKVGGRANVQVTNASTSKPDLQDAVTNLLARLGER